jgi:hypothetical protein
MGMGKVLVDDVILESFALSKIVWVVAPIPRHLWNPEAWGVRPKIRNRHKDGHFVQAHQLRKLLGIPNAMDPPAD